MPASSPPGARRCATCSARCCSRRASRCSRPATRWAARSAATTTPTATTRPSPGWRGTPTRGRTICGRTSRRLTRLRRENPALRPMRFARLGERTPSASVMGWYDEHGETMSIDRWTDPGAPHAAVRRGLDARDRGVQPHPADRARQRVAHRGAAARDRRSDALRLAVVERGRAPERMTTPQFAPGDVVRAAGNGDAPVPRRIAVAARADVKPCREPVEAGAGHGRFGMWHHRIVQGPSPPPGAAGPPSRSGPQTTPRAPATRR